MAGHRLSGATNSITISTGERLILLDTSFSQPISAVDFISTRVSSDICVLSHSKYSSDSGYAGQFSVSDVRPGLPMPSNEDFYHRHYRNSLVVTPLLFTVLEYFEQYLTCFDAGRFLRYAG